jgi:S1/P1 Nuclease
MYRKIARTLVSLCLSLCLLGLMPHRASAWGRDGHQIVAAIALWRLEQLKAKSAMNNISAILNAKLEAPMLLQPKNFFAASVWPDDVRGSDEYSFADNLHFVSILLDKMNDPKARDQYVKTRDCKASSQIPQVTEGICLIGALEHYSKVLATSPIKKARIEALSFIVHFMGDLHQPLHTSEDKSFTNHLEKDGKKGKGDRGGNYRFIFYLGDQPFLSDDIAACLKKPDACTESFSNENGEEERANRKLHAAWDKYMIRTEMKNKPNKGPDFKAYATDLIKSLLKQKPSPQQYADMEAGDFIQWAEEAHDLAEKNAYALIGPRVKTSPADNEEYNFYLLNETYRAKNIMIVDRQLLVAGIRLASVLRRIFPDN